MPLDLRAQLRDRAPRTRLLPRAFRLAEDGLVLVDQVVSLGDGSFEVVFA
jgi:hypothetical protein